MDSQRQTFQPSGRVFLIVAILIFGAANSVTQRLTEIGAANFMDGQNPVSFCNVLFVGNVCAFGLLFLIYFRQLRPKVLQQISLKQWGVLTLIAILSAAVVPSLIFTALSLTSVNNVILVGQIDTPLVLALSVLLLGDRVNAWVIAGAVISFIGVALTVLLQPPGADMVTMASGLQIGQGELLTVLAAVFKAVSNLISKVSLRAIPLGVFNIYRMFIGTITFFFIVLILFEPSHFMDVTSPFLWRWMLLYSAIIVVGGQLAWFTGLKQSTASEISLATAFTPIAGVLAAFLILGEVPTSAQYVGGAVIVIGIGLNQMGVRQLNRATPPPPPPPPAAMSDKVMFKGV
ncbi:MAG: DMT family transporter [Cyanobacteria bacterium P01_F01_bin.56]